MPELTVTRSVDRPLAEIWDFVQDMDNWAPMLEGYEGHEKLSDSESVWTLSGDLGPMSKTVKMRVEITEWTDAERIAFTLTGLDEDVSGGGSFDLTETRPELPERTAWQRLLDWLRGIFGARPKLISDAGAASHVVFSFRVEVGGPMAPMVNAMIGPAAQMVAEKLLERVGKHLDGRTAAGRAAGKVSAGGGPEIDTADKSTDQEGAA